jgi:serine/threonine protein kinase
MSIEFKTLLLSCLRKNPENRISLEEIESHPWFKKYTFSHDLSLRIPRHVDNIYQRPVVSFSRDKLNLSNE